jgi:hypothetical protein
MEDNTHLGNNNTTKLFSSNEYSDLFEAMFSNLGKLAKGDKKIFLDLYYNRDADFAAFETATKHLFETGDNIIIIGEAGIGKSEYIQRLLCDMTLLEDARLFPIMIDYTEQGDINSMKRSLVSQMKQYFDSISQIVTLTNDIDQNLSIIKEAIFNQSNTIKKTKHPVIFIDDLDYAEKDDLFPILKIFLPFSRSPKISIVLSVRPSLYKTLQKNDSTFGYYFTRNVKPITLSNLAIHNILALRLAPILITEDNENSKGILKSIWYKIISLVSKDKEYESLLKRLGINNLDELKKFHFPFTTEYSTFMLEISSNNIRESFDIAYVSLLYILDKYDELKTETDAETKEIRKIITPEQIIDLFKEGSRYTIFDLHKIKSNSNNSLYYNVLEAIKLLNKRNLDAKFYPLLAKMGHNKEDVDNTLKLLARKSKRFLSSNDFTYGQDNVIEPVEYEISLKGEFYLNTVSKWQAYKDKFDSENPTKYLSELIEEAIWK